MNGSRPPIVIDASVALAARYEEASSRTVHAHLWTWLMAREELVVPAHFWLEVVNTLARRWRFDGRRVLEGVHALDELGLTTVEVDRPMMLLTIDHLERHGLTAYDAAYLALTTNLSARLATLDRQLAAAAGDAAIYLGADAREGPSGRVSEVPAGYERRPTWPDYAGASAFLARLRAEQREARTIG